MRDARRREHERVAAAWRALASVEDPEIPALTLVDLGIVRFVTLRPDGVLEVGLSPTYTGCPATEVIRGLVERALAEAAGGRDRDHAGALARLEQRLDHARRGDASSPPTASCRRSDDRSLACRSPVRAAIPSIRSASANSARRPARPCIAAASAWSRSSASNASDGASVLSFHPLEVSVGRAHRRGCGVHDARDPARAARAVPLRRRTVRDGAPIHRRARGAAHLFDRDAPGQLRAALGGARAIRRANVARSWRRSCGPATGSMWALRSDASAPRWTRRARAPMWRSPPAAASRRCCRSPRTFSRASRTAASR